MKICLNNEKRKAVLCKGPSPDHTRFSLFILLAGLGGIALYFTSDPLADPDIQMAGIFGPIAVFVGALIWLSGYWKVMLRFDGISNIRHGLYSWNLPSESIHSAYVSLGKIKGGRGHGDMFILSLVLRVDHSDDPKKNVKNRECLIFEHTRDEKDETFYYIWEQLSDIAGSLNSAKGYAEPDEESAGRN